jgi:hypothetical protein
MKRILESSRWNVVLPAVTLVAALALACAAVAFADEWPTLRSGMWEYKRTMVRSDQPGKPIVVTRRKCGNPAADMKRQNAQLTAAGCRFSPVGKAGNVYTFTAQCSTAGIQVQSRSTLTVENPGAYRLFVESHEGGVTSKETLIARRVGDCAK